MMIFRSNYDDHAATPAEMAAVEKTWATWIDNIAAQQKLAHRGHRLLPSGRTRKPGNVVVDGPYTESKECVCGFIIVKAASLDEAFELARNCPIQIMGGNVEVREVM
jgi:hypothetical protein